MPPLPRDPQARRPSVTVIVVTRPAPAGARLRERLEACGRAVVWSPAFELLPLETPESTTAELQAALPADIVILTSAAAVEHGVALVGPEALAAATVIVPGAGTAAAAARAGVPGARHPDTGGTSEDVLALPELQRVTDQRVLILAAPDGRRTLARVLGERGARVERIAVYRRRILEPSPELLQCLDAGEAPVTLLSSAAAADAIASGLDSRRRARWLGGRFVVSSRRLVARLQSLGADGGRVTVAAGAGDDAMLAALADPVPDIES